MAAFNVNIPGPMRFDTSTLSQNILGIGESIAQARRNTEVRDIFANLRSDDPDSIDEAERRLMQIDPALGIKFRESRQQAADRADAKRRADAASGRSEELLRMQKEAHGWTVQDRMQAEANEAATRAEAIAVGAGTGAPTTPTKPPRTQPVPMDTQILDQLVPPEAVPGVGVVPQGATPVPQSVTPVPQGTTPIIDKGRLDRLLTPTGPVAPPGPGAAMDVPIGGGIDLSAAQRRAPTPPAQTTGLPNPATLNEEQTMQMLGLNVGEGYRKALERRLDQFKEARKEKDKETEAAAAVTGKTLGETLKEKGALRESANKGLYNLEREEQLLRGGVHTGMFSGTRNLIDRAMLGMQQEQKTFGWETPEYLKETYERAGKRAADYEELQGLTALSVYDMLGGFGTGITGPERLEMAKAYSNVAKSEGGNLASLRFRKGILESQKEEGEVFQRYIVQQRQLGRAPRQDEIDYLSNKVQEKHITRLKAQYEADREKYPAMRGKGGVVEKTPASEKAPTSETKGFTGRTATNPQTGKTLRETTDGKWVP